MEKIRRKVEAMSIEEIKKKLPEELLRSIYRSFLALREELRSAKTHKQASKIAAYFLNNFLKNPSFLKTLAYIKEEAEKTKQKDKPEKVKWAENDSKEKTKKQTT